MEKVKVFLGGTVSSSKWRENLIEQLDPEAVDYYNPCVREWSMETYHEENYHSSTDDLYLCVIAPEGRGFIKTISNYTNALNERKKHPESIILCILDEEDGTMIEGEQLYQTLKLVDAAMKSGIIVLSSLEEVAAYLNGYSKKQNTSSRPKRFFKKQ